ncbi:hypothetical protein VTK73DRAFT_2298 [Phialemonium thermophilum]|uniref:Major facilitator superfamily (MFS) profile domain-containing protein n=1 Tax=Phialemonium thermophilum TaxID=223376 RepID=A0ABR3VSB5_9PEZI
MESPIAPRTRPFTPTMGPGSELPPQADLIMGNEEKAQVAGRDATLAEDASPQLKLDSRGLPLVPQPTDSKDDPLISFLALLGPMSAAVINPAFVPLGKAFHITTVEASYELTVYVIFGGVGPLLIIPLANTYGRRPIYLGGNLIAAVTNIAAGYCSNWAGLLATRVFNGIGAGSTVAIGAATICDLYFLHERGFFLGIYTFFLTNGAHVAPLIGGFIAQNMGWRWCFTIPGKGRTPSSI